MAEDLAPPEMTERLQPADIDGARGHAFRYHLAAGFLTPGDVVMDAACGAGYGAEILEQRGDVSYIGVDRDLRDLAIDPTPARRFVEADLLTWPHDTAFDVFVGFETIEHLPSVEHYVATAKQARRWIILSTPVVPTTHLNPFHCRNFAPGELASLVLDEDWSYFQAVLQPSELSEISVFRRRP